MKTHHYAISSRNNSRCPSAPLERLNCNRALSFDDPFHGLVVVAYKKLKRDFRHRVYPIGHKPRGVEFYRGRLCWIVEE